MVWRYLVLGSLLVGCGSVSEVRGPVPLHEAAAPGFQPIWLNRDLRPIGQATAIGAAVVGIVRDGYKLFVVGIDPATGAVRWQRPTTPSWITPGVTLEIVPIGDDRFAYLRPRPDKIQYGRLVVADARTGEDVAASPPMLFSSLPYTCASGLDVCGIATGEPGGRARQFELEIATSDFSPTKAAFPPGSRTLDEPGLLDLGKRPDDEVAWVRDGKIQWHTQVSAAFPAGFSSDNGWTWHRFTDHHALVGTMFGRPGGGGKILDLAAGAATAALDDGTGAVLWRDRGSTVQCSLGRHDYPVNKNYPVRCRRRGTVRIDDANQVAFDGLAVTLEGFAPATGETTWSVDVGAAKWIVDPHKAVAIAGPTEVVVPGPAGPRVLDYATGATTPASPRAGYWCMVMTDYRALPGYDVPPRYERTGGVLAVLCDAERKSASVLPSARATIAAGAHAGDYVVVAGRDGYVGFKLH